MSILIKLYLFQYLFKRKVQIQENRKKLVPIIECIILCGRQEIALRGHNDSGKMCVNGNIFVGS